MDKFPSKLKGVFTALVTPFDQDGALKHSVFNELIQRQVQGGVAGVFIGGSLGEFFSLTTQERVHLFNQSVGAAAGRCSVMVHAGSVQLEEAITLCREGEAAGVDAVSLVTPFYVRYSQGELFEYYARILDTIDVPVLAYNIPALTGVNIAPDTLVRLAARYPHFVGVKDSTGDVSQIFGYVSAAPTSFGVYSGNDTSLLGSYAYGAVGCISATANIIPEIVQELYRSALDGEADVAKSSQKKISELRTIYRFGSVPAVPVKAALRLLGFDVGTCRPPLADVREEDLAAMKQILGRTGNAASATK